MIRGDGLEMETEKVCVIAGAAPIIEKDFLQYYDNLVKEKKEFFLIAADGGYEFLCHNKMKPDLIVGDFDSLGTVPQGANVITHPVMKDDTDMLLAIKEGLKRNCTFFAIFGGVGGRFDHTFANVQHLAYLKEHGARGILFGDTMHMTSLKEEGLCFDACFKGTVSVFALSDKAEGVCISRLKYELENACLTRYVPLGVSNEFIGECSKIQVRQGQLLVMWEKNQGRMPVYTQYSDLE